MPRLVLDEPEVKRSPKLVLDEETPRLVLDEEEPDLFKTLAPSATKLVTEATKPFLFQKPEIVKQGEAQLGREALMLPARALTPIPAGLTEAIKVGKKEGVLPAVWEGGKTMGKAFLKPMDYPSPELALTEEVFPIQPFEQREYGQELLNFDLLKTAKSPINYPIEQLAKSYNWIGNVPRAVAASAIQVLGFEVANNLMKVATTRALNPTEIEGITEAYGKALAKMPENVRANVMPTGNLARVLLGQEQRVARPWISKALGLKPFEAPKPSIKLAGEIPIEKPVLIKPQVVTPEPTMPVIAPKLPIIAPEPPKPTGEGKVMPELGENVYGEPTTKLGNYIANKLGIKYEKIKLVAEYSKDIGERRDARAILRIVSDKIEEPYKLQKLVDFQPESKLFKKAILSAPTGGKVKETIIPTEIDKPILAGMRGELEGAEAGKRYRTPEGEWGGVASSFPQWFKDSWTGMTKKKALSILDKVDKGNSLTDIEKVIYSNMLEGAKHEETIRAEKLKIGSDIVPVSTTEEAIRLSKEAGVSSAESEFTSGEIEKPGEVFPPEATEFKPEEFKEEVQQIIPGAEAKFPESKIPATKYDLIQEKTELEKIIEKQKPSLIKPDVTTQPTMETFRKVLAGDYNVRYIDKRDNWWKQEFNGKFSRSKPMPIKKEYGMTKLQIEENEAFGRRVIKEVSQKPSLLKPSYSMEQGEAPMVGKMVGKSTGTKIVPPKTATFEPIKFEETEPWKVNLGRNIQGVFEKEIGPKLQVSKRMKKWLGVYYPMLGESGTIRVRTLADESTLNHETGHFLDDVLGNYPIEKRGDIRDELIKVTKTLNPFEEKYVEAISKKTGKPLKKQDAYTAYRRSKPELFAEYISMYTTNPTKAKELAPKFTSIVETEIAKDKEFKYVIDKLREFEKEFKPIKDYVDTLRKIPEIQPFLKDWEERGNLFQNLWRDYVGNVIWNKFTGMVDKLGEKPVAREFFEKGGLNNQVFEILRQRKKLIDGQRQRLEEEIIKPISKKTPEDQQYISETLQRLEIGKVTDKELDLLTENARKELSVWGNEARKLGLLNDATFWNNVGQYFPYFYEVKDFEKNKVAFGFFPSKKIRANLSGLKHKLTDEEMGRRVLEAQLGTWSSSKEKIAQYSKKQLEIIGRKAREDMGLIKTAAYPLQKRLFQMIEAVYTVKAFNQIARLPGVIGDKNMPGFIQLPDVKKYGNMAGQYVPENFAREVDSWSTMLGDIDKVLQVTNAVWKNLKVPYSPAANMRNMVTNMVMAYFHDIPIYNPKVSFNGIKSFATRDEVYKVLRDNGLYRHTYSQEELQKLVLLIEKDPENAFEKALEMGVKLFKTPGDVYGFMEDMSKTIIARYVLDNKGTVAQAVKLADKILFDYSSVSRVVAGARKSFLPFITWSAKVFPRLIETVVRKPEKYIMIVLLVAAQAEIARRMLGITKEEEERLKPDSIKKHLAILVPWRDVNNDIQWIDLTYFMPFGGWLPIRKGKLAVPTTLMMGSPLLAFYNAFVLNYDPFLGEIAPDYATDEEKTRLQWKYLGQSLLPDIAWRTPSKIIKSMKGLPDKYGKKSELWKVIAGELAGVRFTSDISAYQGKIKRKAIMNYHLGRRSIYERFKTGEVTKDEKRRLFIKQRQKVQGELTK